MADEVEIEHRLTKIETLTSATAMDVAEVKSLIKEQNGRVATHMEADQRWMAEHIAKHAHGDGYKAGLLAVVGFGAFASGVIGPFVVKAVFG